MVVPVPDLDAVAVAGTVKQFWCGASIRASHSRPGPAMAMLLRSSNPTLFPLTPYVLLLWSPSLSRLCLRSTASTKTPRQRRRIAKRYRFVTSHISSNTASAGDGDGAVLVLC